MVCNSLVGLGTAVGPACGHLYVMLISGLPNHSLQADGAYDFAIATSPQEQFLTFSSGGECPAAELDR